MSFLRPGFLATLVLGLFLPCVAQQPVDNTDIFTLSVTAPTKARDLQVRYYLTGEAGGYGTSVANPTEDNNIVIKTSVQGKSATGLKLIAYAPGCQFVTITIENLASSKRQGTFQCNQLNTVEFFGRADISSLSAKALNVQVLYSCDWASQFFAQGATAISPFTVGKAQIASDGSFTIDLPDFSADPLWPSLTSNASLMFYAVDDKTVQPVAALKAIGSASLGGSVKVAANYPQMQFSTSPN